jgi:hypothetical protein
MTTCHKPLGLRHTLLVLALGVNATAFAQTDPAAGAGSAKPPVAVSSLPIGPTGTPWDSLNSSEKEALAPLAGTWPTLTTAHQKKWVALVQKYPEFTPADRERLRSRMLDWAALSPKDRQIARLQFAETKKLSNDDRMAHWEAYQALPESTKKELSEAAPKKAVGAAVAVKPVAANKLAEVPFTRKTPAPQRTEAPLGKLVDRYTLLPQIQADNNSVLAPVLPAK